MNIHPLFVHFPIALFVLFVFFEFITLFIKNQKFRTGIEHTKSVFIILGILSALPTLITGGIASHLVDKGDIVEVHETFAQLTVAVFGLLAGGYTLRVLDALGWSKRLIKVHSSIDSLFKYGRKLADFVMLSNVRLFLAVVGLVLVTITGALGASIVYGPNIDPTVHFIYSLFM